MIISRTSSPKRMNNKGALQQRGMFYSKHVTRGAVKNSGCDLCMILCVRLWEVSVSTGMNLRA